MKSLMLVFSTIFSFLSITSMAHAANFECRKGTDVLSFSIGQHMGAGPTFYNIKMNRARGMDGYRVFNQVLNTSQKCEDLKMYVRLDKSQVLLCAGEMIAPNGIYGQVIMSNGAVEVFKSVIAPTSGWSCN